MLFRKVDWPGLSDGSITVAFRQWRRPTVKAGGTIRTAAGMLAIDAVDIVGHSTIDDSWAVHAGRESAAQVLAELGPAAPDRHVYRIEFRHVGDDPRIALRADTDLDPAELAALLARLGRLDRTAPNPWTRRVLDTIARNPGVVSTELASKVGMERPAFKLNVRKLKAAGLTESLDVGYRISPRGAVVLRVLQPSNEI